MEFPDLGKHCSEQTCNKLDFLPMKCDSCRVIYCSEHFRYENHACPSAHKKDVQVPVCPLCNEPIPTPPFTSPDITVGKHIDQFCQLETKKIFTNACSYKNCKKKELIPVQCSICKLNFCLKHRHTTDHACEGPEKAQRNILAGAALSRSHNNVQNHRESATRSNASHVQQIQGNMTEDEALAHALALSMQSEEPSSSNNNNNNNNNNTNQPVPCGGGYKNKCSLS